MTQLSIRTINDLYKIQTDSKTYESIYLDVRYFKQRGLLRHAFKYCLFRLKKDGFLEIFSSPTEGYGLSTKQVGFWQVRNECMKSIGKHVEVIHLNNAQGFIRLRKTAPKEHPESISFGIVFSGNNTEEPLLWAALDSIAKIAGLTVKNCQVIIVGGGQYNPEPLLASFPKLRIQYQAMDAVDGTGRILTCKKKSLIFKLAESDLLAISHTRILFPEGFWIALKNKDFEIASPKVIFQDGTNKHPYLDYILIGSYDTARPSPQKAITSSDFGVRHLYLFRNRVPYIDGGVTLFNMRSIVRDPYNIDIAWGEAEDLEMCGRLYYEGYLLDYLPDLVCNSQTNKLKLGAPFWRHPGKLITAIQVSIAYELSMLYSFFLKWRKPKID